MAEADFAARLKLTMQGAGICPSALAERLGVSRETVSRWLGGKRHPSRLHLREIAAAVQRPVSYLEEGVDPVAVAALIVREVVTHGLQGQPVAEVWDELNDPDAAVLSAADRQLMPKSAAELRAILNALAGADWESLPEERQLALLRAKLRAPGGGGG